MSQIHGKQLKSTSVEVGKFQVSGYTGSAIFGSGIFIGMDETPTLGSHLANKDYVDSIASGLDPKDSVQVISVNPITLSGTQSIDGVAVLDGQRVLVAGQGSTQSSTTEDVENGIYIVNASGTWSRAEDSDGSPDNEVSLGNFTFVERGTTYSSTGWVLSDTDASGQTISVGVETQKWTQFSEAGTIDAGAGIEQVGSTFNVDLASLAGLTFSTSGSSGELLVDVGNGIEIDTDGSLAVDLDTSSQLEFSAGELSIADAIAGGGLAISAGGVLSVNSGTGISIVSDDVTSNAGGTLTTNMTFLGLTSGESTIQQALNELETEVLSLNNNTVSDITSGAGLTGSESGSTGSVTLSVNTTNGLQIVNTDFVGLGGTLVQDTTINGDIYDFTITGGGTAGLDTQNFVMSPANEELIQLNVTDSAGKVTGFDTDASTARLLSLNGASGSNISVSQDRITLNANNSNLGSIDMNIDTSSTDSLITDSSGTPKGLQYAGDYSGTFVTNSLVTKQYVDTAINGADITAVNAGAGLTGGGTQGAVTLDVQASNGLSISSDNVVLGGTLSQATSIVGAGQTLEIGTSGSPLDTFDVFSTNAATIDSGQFNVDISGTNVATFDTGTITMVADGASGFDLTIDTSAGDSLITDNAGTASGKGLQYDADYSSGFVANSLITKQYVDDQIATIDGDITAVSAGAGLTGGGTQGAVTLDIIGATGITVSADSIAVDGSSLAGTNITWNSSLGQFETQADITSVNAGDGLGGGGTQGSVTLNVNTGNGITTSGDAVVAVGGTAINVDSSGINVVAGSGITTAGDDVAVIAGSGVTVDSNGVNSNSDGTLTSNLTSLGLTAGIDTIQEALSALQSSASKEVDQETLSFTSSSGDNSPTNITIDATPVNDGVVKVYVNGQLQRYGGDATNDYYFSSNGATGGARAIEDIQSGDELVWNGTQAGFEIVNGDDLITINFEVSIETAFTNS